MVACAPCRTPVCASHAINMFIRTHFKNGAQILSPVLLCRRACQRRAGPRAADRVRDQRFSAEPSSASARAAPSRTWWPTPGRRRRCAARLTRCSTPPPTAPAWCFSRRPRRWAWSGPFDLRHSSLPGAWRSTDIRIECSADACLCCRFRGRRVQQLYTLPCIFVARKTSRDKMFVSHGFRHQSASVPDRRSAAK